jgi:hypothetical protein
MENQYVFSDGHFQGGKQMKVKLRKNLRHFEAEGTDFFITVGEEKEIPTRELRSYDIKYSLMKGNLIPVEGELVLSVKHAKILFSSELHPFCYGLEFGKFFKKNNDTQETFWIDKDEITNFNPSIYEILTGEELSKEDNTPDEVEDEVEEDEIKE